MKSAVVSSLKPMLTVSLPREAAAMALAMAGRSSLALVRQVRAVRGRVLLGKLTQKVLFSWKKSAAVSSLKPMLRVSLPREPVAMALAMAGRSSLAHGRHSGGGKFALKCGKKRLGNFHIFGL